MSVLRDILASTRAEVERRKRELPLAELREQAAAARADPLRRERPFRGALRGPGAAAGRLSASADLVGVPETSAASIEGASVAEAGDAEQAGAADVVAGAGVGAAGGGGDAGAGAADAGAGAGEGGVSIAVIAEFKRRSPSAGLLREAPDLRAIVSAYERGGARAVSVLTDEPFFGGSLQDLRDARAACDLPLLRKDFVLDPYQLHEALAAGADAVLLIVAALEQPALADLYGQARALELDALIEVHDGAELACALELGADLVGVNNRDLRDFSVDIARTFELLEDVPPHVTVVSESGIARPEQLRELHARGAHAVLVGETLMRAGDPEAALRELRGVAGANSLSATGASL